MVDKQLRYRERKKKQGYIRVEVLVPAESAGFVTAYARALRDADKLGVKIPGFEGMTGRSDAPPVQAPANPALSSPPTAGGTSPIISKVDARSTSRPDFSGGLFDPK